VLLAARNAHKALLYAAALLDFDIRWLWPSAQAEGALCSCPVTAEALTGALHALAQQGISPFGVYVTSPDYLGGVQGIPALAAVCRAQGVPLLVDNAHGAYLRFLPQNCHPIAQGAAMCCDSAHKTLPVVTGGAYLHLAHDAPVQDEATVRGALALFGSTSPSYLILQSLDACNAVLAGDYPRRLVQCCAALEGLRRSLNKAAAARQCPVPLAVAGAQQEPMKLTLDAGALGCTGTAPGRCFAQCTAGVRVCRPPLCGAHVQPGKPTQEYSRLQATLESFWLLCCRAVLSRDRAGEFADCRRQACNVVPSRQR
jgi:Arginine/lysine/ornithine decarboxylases